jgi:hypothetical protein
MIRLVPLTFLLYQFYSLLFAACFTVVVGNNVDNDCKNINLIGTDRIQHLAQRRSVGIISSQLAEDCFNFQKNSKIANAQQKVQEAREDNGCDHGMCCLRWLLTQA